VHISCSNLCLCLQVGMDGMSAVDLRFGDCRKHAHYVRILRNYLTIFGVHNFPTEFVRSSIATSPRFTALELLMLLNMGFKTERKEYWSDCRNVLCLTKSFDGINFQMVY
jgi:hypothetical protein